MNREDIIRMAWKAGFERLGHTNNDWVCYPEDIERFAALVAKHTLSNIDPSSFMTWQEGYEAGKQTEREACARVCEENWHECGGQCANVIRYGGKQE